MNKKSFLLGVLAGIVLTLVGLFIVGVFVQDSVGENTVQYLEKPVSYESKEETSFKVLQVLDEGALAREASDIIGGDVMYFGNIVLVIGQTYYSDQIITVRSPMRVGTFSYTTNGGMPKTVPVINGEMK